MLHLPVYTRSGIYYLHTRHQGQQFKRSLHTRDKQQAMLHALQLLGSLMDYDEVKKLAKKFEATLNRSTGEWKFKTDPNIPNDVEQLGMFVKTLSVASEPSAPTPPINLTGTSIQEVADRYQTRHAKLKSAKTLYEYGNYHKHFITWITKRKKVDAYPMRLVTNEDMGVYIDDLFAEGKSPQAVQTKYLGALNALFEFGKTIGAYPKEQEVPSRGHKLFNKAKHKSNRKPFTLDELKEIFKPENLLKSRHPDQFWLPLLGLFTGGRIGELTQLRTTDFQQIGGIWSISINEEEDKTVKTSAGIRIIPIHYTLIELGLLDYVEEIKKFNGLLFPELVPDQFGHYGKQPSRRFATYLDTLGITEKSKVFHSFRSTSNNTLKQAGVAEESRCQFIGHEHETVNSSTYAEPHSIPYLLEHVASKLCFDVDFSSLKYSRGKFTPFIQKELMKQKKKANHQEAKKQLA